MLAPLHRSTANTMIGGVCGGLAETFHCDPVTIRLLFAFMAIMDGAGVMLYLLLWMILPSGGQAVPGPDAERTAPAALAPSHANAARTTGIVLIITGTMFLLQRLNISLFGWMPAGVLLPIALIAGGVFLALRRRQGAPIDMFNH